MYRAVITDPAKRDVQAAHDWWAENRSAERAGQWYVEIYKAIASLNKMPERCDFAPERNLLDQGIRQLLFGIGKRPTHRIVFAVDRKDVVILRVRHISQVALMAEDLE